MKVCGVHGSVVRGTALLCSRPQGGGLIRPAGRRADITLSAVVGVRRRQKQRHFSPHFIYRIHQRRQIIFYDFPDDFEINPEIFVSQQVSEIFYILPFNIRPLVFQLLGESANCFADYFKFPDHCRVCLSVVTKFFKGQALYELENRVA
jgi:hypothetical protein